jgi:long-subunit fatty acid transport protein
MTNDDGTMPFGGDPFYWGPTLAYKNGVTNKDEQGWFIDRIGSEAEIDQYNAVQTRGSIGEYALTIGFNLMDKIYIGASLGLQSLDYRREVFYGEDYIYTEETLPTGEEMPYQLTYMNYQQNSHISGMGVNLKFGITARPVNWLRIGVAYHSPTWYDANFQYGGSMWSETYSAGNNPEGYDLNRNGYFHDDVSSPVLTDEGPHGWNFRSPSRLLTGVAVTIGRRVILSADYERSWYQTNRLESSPIQGLASGYTPTFKDVFKGSNTVRVGAEAYILPSLPIRVGYIWNGSTLRDGYEDIVASHPMVTEQWFATAGFGIKFSESLYLDFAYQYGVSKQSKYQSFYGYYTDREGNTVDELTTESRLYSTHTNRHHAVLTLGFRF